MSKVLKTRVKLEKITDNNLNLSFIAKPTQPQSH